MPQRTGEKCKTTGKYQCITHPLELFIKIKKGESIPNCDIGNHPTSWILISKIPEVRLDR